MIFEIIGNFTDSSSIASLSQFILEWLETMQRAAQKRDWGLYRLRIVDLANQHDITVGSFEPFPDTKFSKVPQVGHKGSTIRIHLETPEEEDLDAIEEILEAVGADSVESQEQIDPNDL